MFKEEINLFLSKLQKDSLLKFSLEQGFVRLGSEAALGILLLILLRKTTLTAFEFFMPLVIGPVIGFLYCTFIWRFQRYKTGGHDQ